MTYSFLQRLAASELYGTEDLVIKNHTYLIASLRQYLKINEYDMALACLDLAIEKKAGSLRGDGKSPGILHEVSQALYAISLIEDGVYIANPESVIALIMVHDLGEDYGLKPDQLREYLETILVDVADADTSDIIRNVNTINNLTKDFDTITKAYLGEPPKFENEYEYYLALQESENASIAKLIDRLHNMATQVGVKPDHKCMQYISDTMVIAKDYVLHASKKFPEQRPAYESCHDMIKTVCQVNRYYLSRDKIGKKLPTIAELEKEMPDKGFAVPHGINPIFISSERIMKLTGWESDRKAAFETGLSKVLRLGLGRFNLL